MGKPSSGASFLNPKSERLPNGPLVSIMRWWLPAALCLVGIVLLLVDDFDGFGVAAFAAFVGAGTSIWLTNFLWRLGISGDDERDSEARDRAYLAEHGHWPDEPRQNI
jgi:hypothetical protein